MEKKPYKFCAHCGAPVIHKIPDGDNRKRYVCTHCDAIFYENPKIVAGCLLSWEGKVLMCKRATNPRKGFWTLPAGFLENHETVEEGARRETVEEAHAQASTLRLFMMCNLPHISQLYMIYEGKLIDGQYKPGPESEEVSLFLPEQIPWDNIAFTVIEDTLKRYLQGPTSSHILPYYHTIDRRNEY